MKKVLLDTSFVISLYERPGISFEEEIERLIEDKPEMLALKSTIAELKRLAMRADSIFKKKKYLWGLRFIEEKCRILGEEDEVGVGRVDEEILKRAVSRGYIVATNDATLRKRLRDCGIPVIFIRGGNHLGLEGEI